MKDILTYNCYTETVEELTKNEIEIANNICETIFNMFSIDDDMLTDDIKPPYLTLGGIKHHISEDEYWDYVDSFVIGYTIFENHKKDKNAIKLMQYKENKHLGYILKDQKDNYLSWNKEDKRPFIGIIYNIPFDDILTGRLFMLPNICDNGKFKVKDIINDLVYRLYGRLKNLHNNHE